MRCVCTHLRDEDHDWLGKCSKCLCGHPDQVQEDIDKVWLSFTAPRIEEDIEC